MHVQRHFFAQHGPFVYTGLLFIYFQERVSVVSSNCTSVEKLDLSETDALYPTDSDTKGASCFPERQRGKNIFKPRNYDNKPKPKVPYRPVEKVVT